MSVIITRFVQKSRVFDDVYKNTSKSVNLVHYLCFRELQALLKIAISVFSSYNLKNKTTLWELWGESRSAALLYYIKWG